MSANRRAPGIYGQRPPQWNSPETRLDSDIASEEKVTWSSCDLAFTYFCTRFYLKQRWVRDSDPISDASYFHPTTSEDFKARKAAHNRQVTFDFKNNAFHYMTKAPSILFSMHLTGMFLTSHLQLQEARPRVQAEPDGAGRAQAVHRVRRGVRQGHHLREPAAVAQDQARPLLKMFS